MNQILNFAFVPFILACAIRYFVAQAMGVHPLDVRTFSQMELYGYGICTTLAAISIWHLFFRASCSNCGSYAVRHVGTEELRYYPVERKRQEKDNNGRTVTRYMNVTISEMRSHFDCTECGNKWKRDFKQDKK